jgi:hypothetical protein
MPFFSQISENFCLFDFLYSSLPILKRCSDNFLTNLACHHKIVNFDFNYKFDDLEWLNIFFSKKNNNKKSSEAETDAAEDGDLDEIEMENCKKETKEKKTVLNKKIIYFQKTISFELFIIR